MSKPLKPRSPHAQALAETIFRPRKVQSAKRYSRKKLKRPQAD